MMRPHDIALSQYGTKGISGKTHNPEVVRYFKDSGHAWVVDDETAWCAAFLNWCLKKGEYPDNGALNARSFLTYGKPTTKPEVGDIVVLWRISRDGPYGHVGFFVRATKDVVYILGGNQSNEVNIKAFPIDQLLGYRKITV
jgi:uncharacterized protein (TIGR02594 family)